MTTTITAEQFATYDLTHRNAVLDEVYEPHYVFANDVLQAIAPDSFTAHEMVRVARLEPKIVNPFVTTTYPHGLTKELAAELIVTRLYPTYESAAYPITTEIEPEEVLIAEFMKNQENLSTTRTGKADGYLVEAVPTRLLTNQEDRSLDDHIVATRWVDVANFMVDTATDRIASEMATHLIGSAGDGPLMSHTELRGTAKQLARQEVAKNRTQRLQQYPLTPIGECLGITASLEDATSLMSQHHQENWNAVASGYVTKNDDGSIYRSQDEQETIRPYTIRLIPFWFESVLRKADRACDVATQRRLRGEHDRKRAQAQPTTIGSYTESVIARFRKIA